MKVLQINAVYGYGSTGVIVRDIHEMCLKTGIESYVAYSTSPSSLTSIKNGYVIGNVIGKKLHALLCRINGQQAYFSTYATKQLLDHIKKISPDIVHLHNLHSNYVNLNKLLKYLANNDIKTVITLHDCWFYTGGCFHYTEAKCSGWTDKCEKCPKKLCDTPAYIFDRSSDILNDRKKYFGRIKSLTTVGVSEWISSEAKKSFLSNSDIRTIYNGVDLDFFKHTSSKIRENLGIDAEVCVVLGMANKWLLPGNQIALTYLTSNLPKNAVMLLVGCTDEQRKTLPSNVIGIGYINERAILRDIYSTSNVFVNCTREESLSLVNIEAQACGLPIITYSNTGAKETVDNRSSFSVEDGNYHELTKKVIELITNNNMSSDRNCSMFIKNRFNLVDNYQKYIDLYYELCDTAKEEKQ